MKKIIFLFIILTFLFLPMLKIQQTQAVSLEDMHNAGLGKIGEEAFGGKTPKNSISEITAKIIQFLLSFLGLIFVILTMYGGFLWMTANGNDDKISRSKDIIKNGIIGIIIILASYAITHFVLENIIKVTSN